MNKYITSIFIMLAAMTFFIPGCSKRSTIPDESLQSAATELPGAGSGSQGKTAAQDAAEGIITDVEELPISAPSGSKAKLETVYFDFDSWVLSGKARETIGKNHDWIKLNPREKILIEGYTDERGSDAYNIALGERRASAAVTYLTNLGVARERLSVISYGEENPADPGHNEEAWSKNRRIEFIVVK